MTDDRTRTTNESTAETDGGVTAKRSPTNYLDAEVNIFRPETAFMRDHLKLIWTTFLAWTVAVFGPVTASLVVPNLMTETIVLGFQLHILLTAIGAPFGALVLSAVYAHRRDKLDEKYGIEHGQTAMQADSATATDGGEGA
jgi:putative solute:sodium symporter small subunit